MRSAGTEVVRGWRACDLLIFGADQLGATSYLDFIASGGWEFSTHFYMELCFER